MDEEITQFQEALENLPEEVKNFLYGGDFESAVSTIANTHSFTEEQIKQFDLTLTDVICLLASKDKLIELFTSWGFPQEKQALLVKDIEEKVFMPIIEATNYIVEWNDEEDSTSTPHDPYEQLQKRFVYGTPIVRTEKKSYSLDTLPLPPRIKDEEDSLIPPEAPKRVIDPYREKPE